MTLTSAGASHPAWVHGCAPYLTGRAASGVTAHGLGQTPVGHVGRRRRRSRNGSCLADGMCAAGDGGRRWRRPRAQGALVLSRARHGRYPHQTHAARSPRGPVGLAGPAQGGPSRPSETACAPVGPSWRLGAAACAPQSLAETDAQRMSAGAAHRPGNNAGGAGATFRGCVQTRQRGP